VQDTQPHIPAQPGTQAQNFQAHLQQQLNGVANSPIDIKPVISSPQPSYPHQQQALQELQRHMEWYNHNFGSSNTHIVGVEASALNPPTNSMPVFDMGQPMQGMSPTSASHAQSRTMPSTPQTYSQAWPSPPTTHAKHGRSQSFQLDVAPMPDSNSNTFAPDVPMQMTFNQASGSFTTNPNYASSVYSSSQVDPVSSPPQHPTGHMPTVFEEPTQLVNGPLTKSLAESNILLQATAGVQDFNDPDFNFGASMGMSPRQQMLNNLRSDLPASIINTGIPPQEVQRYIGEPTDNDNKYPCLYPGCKRVFGRKENVRAHIQTHLGDRQFKCDICDKTFVRQHDLKRHVAIHSDERPFVCACSMGFARQDALTRHRQRGVCIGCLPGYEKSEEEKPKRGRPKKERPDLESRADKANKQRKKNKTKANFAGQECEETDIQIIYASSISGASDHSLPITPPDTSDFDAEAFLNLANAEMSAEVRWKDTPPTSPMCSSPSKTVFRSDLTLTAIDQTLPVGLYSNSSSPVDNNGATIFECCSPGTSITDANFYGGSSPADMDFFQANGVNVEPSAVFNAFSPPGESNSSQSVFTDTDIDVFDELEREMAAMANESYSQADHMPKPSGFSRKQDIDFEQLFGQQMQS